MSQTQKVTRPPPKLGDGEFVLHLVPKFYGGVDKAELVDLRIEPFGVLLRGGIELATRQPYPNRCIWVGCRRTGQRAINGLLVRIPRPEGPIFAKYRWALDADLLVEHHVRYTLTDNDHDAASEECIMWFGTDDEVLGRWPNRWPDPNKWKPGIYCRTIMELAVEDDVTGPAEPHRAEFRATMRDRHDEAGQIVMRHQDFAMPTIELDRLTAPMAGERMPQLADAFRARVLA